MLYNYDAKKCLNGWWDIRFADQWNQGKYLVPSVWNKSPNAIREKGEKYFNKTPEDFSETNEYLFDAFGYPLEWNKYSEADIRRKVQIRKQEGKRYFLVFEGVAPIYILFVNGAYVGSHTDPSLPYIPDITEYTVSGENEILLEIRDFTLIDGKKSIFLCGNGMLYDFRGIWQDVYLLERDEVYMEDVTIKTSVRKNELMLTYVIKNTAEKSVDCVICSKVEGEETVKIPDKFISAQKGTTEITFSIPWKCPELWSPNNPRLYALKVNLGNGMYTERFGFREVWVDGYNLMFNGYPIHLFSDWGHKMTQFNHTGAWVQKWFDMMKDGNMNHSRLHTHPHPRFILDMADEQGILITGETAIFGSGGCQAGDSEEYWENARRHVINFVKRDKNHPSVIMWSVENEMRWNGDKTDLPKKQLPLLRLLFNELDDTRVAYHEGDSSWWNEKEQTMLSRHYGKECSGMGWWDKSQPLNSGELACYHYASPNNTMHILGDRVWEDYRYIDRAAAIDLALTAEDARANDVICLGPWNISCLSNLRPSMELVKLMYEDYTAAGVKPLQVMPGSSEFEFWKEGKGYFPQESFNIQAHAFRPFAVIDSDRQSQYFIGNKVNRTLNIINDTAKEQEGILTVGFGKHEFTENICVKRGENLRFSFKLVISEEGECEYSVKFNGKSQLKRTIHVAAKQKIRSSKRIGILGNPKIGKIIENAEVIKDTFNAYDIILIEKNTVKEGSGLNQVVRDYLGNGGRVMLMEQEISLFPGLQMKTRPVLKAFIRDSASPVLKGIGEEELEFWGSEPFTQLSGDSYVVEYMYEKGRGDYAFPIIDSGEGGFGHGDMDNTALFEAVEGKGIILACQLRISDKIDSIPATRKLLQNMFDYLESWKPSFQKVLLTNKLEEALDFDGNVILDASEEVLEYFKLEKVIEEEGIWQGIKKNDIRWLNNEDLCGIETFSYSRAGAQNYKVADFAFKGDLEALVVTPSRSILKELFIFGGQSEPLRAYTASNYCYYGQNEENMLVGKSDNIYISSFHVQGRIRFERLKNFLIRSLGGRFETSLLEGEITAKGESKGYPEQVYLCPQEVNVDIFVKMLESTTYQTERMNPTAILDMAPFQTLQCEEGFIHASGSLCSYIFYTIESRTVRKDVGNDLGIPNPDALTFLELIGNGDVQVWINAKPVAALLLKGEGIISDVEIERGYNHVFIRWTARQESDILRTYWRNISRKAETGFKFIAKTYSGN